MNPIGRRSHESGDSNIAGEPKHDDELAKKLQNLLFDSRDGLVYSPGLWRNLMTDFTLTFLITNPKDLITFGLEYFRNLRTKRIVLTEENTHSVKSESIESQFTAELTQLGATDGRSGVVETVVTPTARLRRKSVFADVAPDSDENDEWKPAVHPKTDEQRRNCRQRMKEVMLFREVAPDDLNLLVDAMAYKEVDPGERVIIQGADGDYFYIIDSGLFEAYHSTSDGVRVIAKYNNHGTFGELALMYNVPRACSVKALTRSALWALDRDTFKRVVVKGAKRKRTRYMNFLHKVPLLKNLNEYEMLNLADSFQRRTFNVGDCVIKQGDDADGMYFIEYGKVNVSMTDERGVEIDLHELEVGDYFGELALLDKKPRAASAFAVTEVKVAFLNTEAFERLLGPCRALMERKVNEYKKQASRSKFAHEMLISPDTTHGSVKLQLNGEDSEADDREPVLVQPTRRSSAGKPILNGESRWSTRSTKVSNKPSIFSVLPEVMSKGGGRIRSSFSSVQSSLESDFKVSKSQN